MRSKFMFLASLVMVMSLLVGGATVAAFTASAGSSNHTFSSGQIVIDAQRDDLEPCPGPLFYLDNTIDGATPTGVSGIKEDGYWYPGKISEDKVLDVHNAADSIPVKLTALEAEVADPTPQDGVDDSILQNALEIRVTKNGTLLWEGMLSELSDGSPEALATELSMPVDSRVFLNFTASMPSDLPGDDNQYQGKNIMVRFIVHVAQQ